MKKEVLYYASFKDRCRFYINKFGMQFWHFQFTSDGNFEKETMAKIYPFIDAWDATICFNEKFREGWTKSLVNRAAKHEILHLVFSPIEEWSKWRFVDEKTLNRELECLMLFIKPYVNNPSFFIGRLSRLSKERFVTDGEISQEIHRLIVYLDMLIR